MSRWFLNSMNYTPSGDVVVPWSGGCDSTALLYCLAKCYPTITIYAYSIYADTGCRNADKVCREVLKEIFAERGLTNIEYADVECSGKFQTGVSGLGQPTIWVTLLPYLATTDEVCFAYIRGDDIWHYKHNFVEAYKNICAIREIQPKLYFPMEWISKQDILHYLDSENLLQYCNTCEHADEHSKDGEIGRCKYCKDCKELTYFMEHKDDEPIKDITIEEIKEEECITNQEN